MAVGHIEPHPTARADQVAGVSRADAEQHLHADVGEGGEQCFTGAQPLASIDDLRIDELTDDEADAFLSAVGA